MSPFPSPPAGWPPFKTARRGSVIPKGEGRGTYQSVPMSIRDVVLDTLSSLGNCLVSSLPTDAPFVLVLRPGVNVCDTLGGRQGQTGRPNRVNPTTKSV